MRVGHDKSQYEKFFEGFTPLEGEDIAHGAVFMLAQPLNVSVKALDIVPTGKPTVSCSLRWPANSLVSTKIPYSF